MKKLKYIILMSICICIISCPMYAAEAKFINDVAQINGYDSKKEPVKIIVATTKYSSDFPYRYGFMWGADDTFDFKPHCVVTKIEIVLKNKPVFIPLSVYSDLADPNKVVFTNKQNAFSLSIYGGDAGTSYIAKLFFEGSYIKYRKVVSGEFPDQVWEKTEYHFNTLNN